MSIILILKINLKYDRKRERVCLNNIKIYVDIKFVSFY